ncbi:hypothetical protein HUJ04_001259 [Dendroctonus ponderosae]
MEWTNELVIKFLDLFEREEAIWNGDHELHRNRDFIRESWLRIKTDLGGQWSVAELKKKKESLMSTFRKISQKIKKKHSTNRPHKTNWFAYAKMDKFLHNHYRPVVFKYPRDLIQDVDTPETSQRISDDNSDSLSDTPSQESSSSSWQDAVPPKKIKLKEPFIKTKNRAVEDCSNSRNATDNCSLYGELLANKLKDFDQHKQQLAMLQIDQLMYFLKYQKLPSANPFNLQPQPDKVDKLTNGSVN